MSEPRRFDALRSTYRREREAHALATTLNKLLTQAGKQPTREQLVAENTGAAAVKLARARLHAAVATANTPYSVLSERGMKALAWRYKAAFDAYLAIVTVHARQALTDAPTSVAELMGEEQARKALAAAKRDLELFGSRGHIRATRVTKPAALAATARLQFADLLLGPNGRATAGRSDCR